VWEEGIFPFTRGVINTGGKFCPLRKKCVGGEKSWGKRLRRKSSSFASSGGNPHFSLRCRKAAEGDSCGGVSRKSAFIEEGNKILLTTSEKVTVPEKKPASFTPRS